MMRLGPYIIHPATRTVSRNGLRVRLYRQSYEVLLMLLERPGDVVTREDLKKRLWPDETFVDFDHGLNAAVRNLRRVLGDSPESPTYIETLPRVGYRLIAPVDWEAERVPDSSCGLSTNLRTIEKQADGGEPLSRDDGNEDSSVEAGVRSASPNSTQVGLVNPDLHARQENRPTDVSTELISARVGSRGRTITWVVGAIAIAAPLLIWWRTPLPVPIVESITEITADGQIKNNGLVTDGSRIYFNEGMPYAVSIAQVSVTGGRAAPLESKLKSPYISGILRDGSALLVQASTAVRFSLWSIPLPAGEPRNLGYSELLREDFLPESSRLQNFDVYPDGRFIFASGGKEVFITDNNGSNPRKLVSVPGKVVSVRVAPNDGRVLISVDSKDNPYFDDFDTLEMAADGSGLHRIRKASPDECCFEWSWDGKYLLYSSRAGTRWDLWALPMERKLLERSQEPVRLTNGPVSFAQGAVPSRDGKQLFAVGAKEHGELVRYDMKSRQFIPLLSGISATDATFSNDGKWVAYTSYPDHILWVCRSDGSERKQLTYPPMEAQWPFISPDGTKIAFGIMGKGVFVMDRKGDALQRIGENITGPRWSPDGNSLVVDTILPNGDQNGLQIIDVHTLRTTEVPRLGKRFAGGFWMGENTLGAFDFDTDWTGLAALDLKTNKWTHFAAGLFGNSINSPDGKYIYISTMDTPPSLQRIRIADHHVETIVSLKDFSRVINYGWTQLRVAPDGSPTLTRAVDDQEVYRLDVRWP